MGKLLGEWAGRSVGGKLGRWMHGVGEGVRVGMSVDGSVGGRERVLVRWRERERGRGV